MKIYTYNHQPISFDFEQTIDRFFVEEIPMFRFSGQGNYLVLKIKKRDMSTWKLIHVLSKATGLSERDIGYAGLKDKSATTIQYLSIPKQAERELKNLTTEKIEIVGRTYNKMPIKIGQLKGNRFSIVLHQVTTDAASAISKTASQMSQKGIPNYFGYQRFGEDSRSYLQGKTIAPKRSFLSPPTRGTSLISGLANASSSRRSLKPRQHRRQRSSSLIRMLWSKYWPDKLSFLSSSSGI